MGIMFMLPLQSYIMDCYFRQSWVDKRLSFEGYEVSNTKLFI